jgi:putative MFS transporter
MSATEFLASDRCGLVTARLDRLPATRYIWKLVFLLSLGGCFEFYDLFLMTYIAPGLVRGGLFAAASRSLFDLHGLAAFISATFAGLFLGTLVFAFVADHFGRRAVFTYALVWYVACSAVMAFQGSATHILVWRMIAAVGIGVELVTIDTYIVELMPKQLRGAALAINHVVQLAAIPIVALISWRLVPLRLLGLDGWRWVVLIGSVGALVIWLIRRGIPESPRWLIARGRLAEAEYTVAKMEEQVAQDAGVALDAAVEVSPASSATLPGTKTRFGQIFAPPLLGRTVMLMVFQAAQTIGYYGFSSWVPTFLMATGIHFTASLEYSFIIAVAAPLGPLFIYRLADKVERKWQIALSASSIASFGLLFARQHQPAWLIVFGVLITCSNNWMSAAFHTYQAELFPTPIRARAVGFVYSWSRFSAIFTSLTIGYFLEHFGMPGVFVFIAAAMLVVVLSIGIFGPYTRGLALESISR